MERKIIVLRERTRRTRHRSRKDVRARRRICGVLAALCFLLLLGVVGGMENGTMALGIGTVRVMGTGTAGVLLGLSFRPDVFVYRRGAALGISAPPQDDAGRVRPSERRQGTGCGAAVWL